MSNELAEPTRSDHPRAHSRDTPVDVLRGLAIVAMIGANMAAHNLRHPHPFLFRVYGSLAAPAFIFVAGMMVGHTTVLRGHPLRYYAKRAAALMVVAAVLDVVCWQVTPFTTFDVLYLIGLALPLSRLFLHLRATLQAVSVSAVFVLTPLLQQHVGYPTMLSLGSDELVNQERWSTLHQLLVGGWFPVFPWLGVALLGAAAGRARATRGVAESTRRFLLAGTSLFVIGVVSWVATRPELAPRGTYSELFYPPTLQYLASALGVVLVVLALLPRSGQSRLLALFATYGHASLLMYIAHLALIVVVFKVMFGPLDFPTFALLYVVHAVVLWPLARWASKVGRGKRSFWLRFLLGGS